MTTAEIQSLYGQYVIPTYAQVLALVRGEGCHVWDPEGKRYLDMTGGIAVSSLGHRHPSLVRAISEQAGRLIHASNLFFNEWQPKVAEKIVGYLGAGKCFFSNSGAEANEGLFKLARKWGDGRYEIVYMRNSFHGRTLATVAATGQEKIRRGFDPLPEGFRQAEFNDLESVKKATGEKTVAVIFECIQGEGGVRAAEPGFVSGLRQWCDRNRMLLLCDCIQCGIGRTGKFCSFQHFDAVMDGVSLAKSLGGGFPIGAVWVREPYAGVLTPGSHATTFGGSPLAARAAFEVLDVIEKDGLIEHAGRMGELLAGRLKRFQASAPGLIRDVRGKGLMIGIELTQESRPWALKLAQAGLLVIPTGTHVLRLLPPLIIGKSEIDEAVLIVESVLKT